MTEDTRKRLNFIMTSIQGCDIDINILRERWTERVTDKARYEKERLEILSEPMQITLSRKDVEDVAGRALGYGSVWDRITNACKEALK